MSPLLTFTYWFAFYPPTLLTRVQTILAIAFAILIIAGIQILYVWRRRVESKARKHALTWIGHLVLWLGVGAEFWLAMTSNSVPLLGMRIWLPVGVLAVVWGLMKPIRELRFNIPAAERGSAERAAYEKWLPKPKK